MATEYKVLGQAQATTYPTTVYTVPEFVGTVGAAVISSITMSNTSATDATVDVYLLGSSGGYTSVYDSFNYSNGGDGSGPSVMVYANGMFTGIPVETALRAVNSTDGINWTSSGGTSARGPYNDFIYANSTYIAVGEGTSGGEVVAKIAVSTDTITWTTKNVANAAMVGANAITYGNGTYVMAGGSGFMVTSTDTISWTSRTSTFGSTNINGLAYGNSVYVAVGSSGQLRTSTDAITWTTSTSNFGTTSIRSVAYGNDIFLAVGGPGINATSSNGTTWTLRTAIPSGYIWSSTGYVSTAKFEGGRFLLTGSNGQYVAISTNGITWTYTRPGSFIPTVAAFENGLLVAGSGVTLTASLNALPYKSNALVYGTTIPANSSTTITAGITLPEGFTVQTQASAASSITVHAFGCEIY